MTVLAVDDDAAAGHVEADMPPSSAFSPAATPTPRARPTTEATRPTTTASRSTEPSTWRRLAPMARSSAISCVRWATRIEKVL